MGQEAAGWYGIGAVILVGNPASGDSGDRDCCHGIGLDPVDMDNGGPPEST
jgi:hypothetical protein